LNKFVELLKSGEVVAFPTETVYGLGAIPWNNSAVKKVFEIKGRPQDNPLIVHVCNTAMANEFAAYIPEQASMLMEKFWPGPLTLIYKKKPEVPDIVTGGLPTVAVRWPRHPVAQELIEKAGPLVAPSANSSGKPSPTKPEHVRNDFGENFPVIEGGETQIGLESTILDVSQRPFCVYRPGAVGREEIQNIIGEKIVEADLKKHEGRPVSPGTKYTHYSPEASVRWLQNNEKPENNRNLYLFHDKIPILSGSNIIHYSGNYNTMAKELYDRFRQADFKKMEEIVIEPFSDHQLQSKTMVKALRNRISKAAG